MESFNPNYLRFREPHYKIFCWRDGQEPGEMASGEVGGMLNFARRVWRYRKRLVPIEGFFFDRPLVLIQSDDWGRVGVRDREGWEELVAAGVPLGERPSDFYSLETAEDVAVIVEVLTRHRDSTGRAACLVANFICANVDFRQTEETGFRKLTLRPLGEGLPERWKRPGLIEAYRAAISEQVMLPALHGMTHFCRPAVERGLGDSGENGDLLRTFFRSGTPYIHWRMPWVGFEYFDPEAEEQFLALELQSQTVSQAADAFSNFFGIGALSACAPGYRRNQETLKAWSDCGIKIAQNGPGTLLPPHFEQGMLHLHRNVQFEPALDPSRYSVEACVEQAARCFDHGIPAVVSVHSINFHSSLKNFRDETLLRLDMFLSILERENPRLLYVHDHDVLALVNHGCYGTGSSRVSVRVKKSMVLPNAAKYQCGEPEFAGTPARLERNG